MSQSTQLPTNEVMYQALVNRDSQYEGVFIAAIRTTGIFCRPTCGARKPKAENVEYYPDTRAALAAGYRACKLCRPMELAGATPAWIQSLLEEVEADPGLRLKAADLRRRGLDPTRVRRWFQKHHGLTFSAFLRLRRLNRAFELLQEGETVTQTALAGGYASTSGLNIGFKNVTGLAPNDSRQQSLITLKRILTPLGPMMAGATADGICLLEFTDRRQLETQLDRLQQRLNATVLAGTSPFFAPLEQQLEEYFHGQRKEFDLPLVVPGTEFQQAAWRALERIPYGQTRSYQQQAKALGRPSAVRAVARANGDNRIAIIIPCHRVIGADGRLTGYGGGLWRKQRLLELEGAAPSSAESKADQKAAV